MEKSRSYEIIEYRKKIEQALYTSPEIIKLLGCEKEECPEDIIPYNYSFPYEYIPGTQDEAKRFINYEISAAIDPNNNLYNNLTIFFYIVCHKDIIQYKENGEEILWYDKAVSELDTLFCGKHVLGIGKISLTNNDPYNPNEKYRGRLLKFIVKDFNKGLKYGK